MKEENMDLFIGVSWIIISIMQTFLLGLKSWVVWSATIIIWLFIIRARIERE